MSFQATIFDELTPIYPDTDTADGYVEYAVAGCNGTVVGAHIVMSGLIPGLPVTVAVKGEHRCYKLFTLRPVPVEVNCGAKLRTEYLKDDVNEDVIRRAPFMVYEALDPFYNIFLPATAYAAIAFKTPVEYCRQHRKRVWEIAIGQGGVFRTLTLRVSEFPVVVPRAGADTFRYVNWFDFSRMATDFGCEKWSERYFKIFGQYLRAAVFSRQNILCIGMSELFDHTEDDRMVLNVNRFDRIIRVAVQAGISLFHGGAFAVRKAYGNDEETYASLDHDRITDPEEIARCYRDQAFDRFDHCSEAQVGITGQELPGRDGEETLCSMAAQIYTYLEQNGLTDVWYQCILDEPNPALAPVYRRLCELTKSVMPGIPILEPVLDFRSLEGTLDIWCPSLDQYEQNLDFYSSRTALGDHIWVYACLTPAANYCNRLLDMERLRAVWIGWAPMVYPDIEGFLHWGGNHSVAGGPFRRQAGSFSESVLEFHPKHAMFLPAGDAAIFFPGDDGPMISTRSEAHRIGFEDLYLLKELKEKSPDSVLPLVNKVFRRFNDFEKDVSVYRNTRRRLLELLDEIVEPEG